MIQDAAPAVHIMMDQMLRGEFKPEEPIKVTIENVDYHLTPNLEKADSAIKKFCANNNKFMEDSKKHWTNNVEGTNSLAERLA